MFSGKEIVLELFLVTPFLIWSIAKVFIIVVEYILRCAKFWRIIIIILVTVLDFILLLGRSRHFFSHDVERAFLC